MTDEAELKVDAEGIFVSCSRGASRLWEFHPDDVTAVGVYQAGGDLREVIATVIRDFDISEKTGGRPALNERLSRELKGRFVFDSKRGTSQSGLVLWPAHLAGGPLFEFWITGKDGLADYVPPGTPNAIRTLSQAVGREMSRDATHRLPKEFPEPLFAKAFVYHGFVSFTREDAVKAAEWLHGKGAAIVDAELWLVKDGVAQPHVRTKTGVVQHRYWTTTHPGESWEIFAKRTLSEVVKFIREFQWPDNSAESGEPDARFCLVWVWKEWIEEDDFRFPAQAET